VEDLPHRRITLCRNNTHCSKRQAYSLRASRCISRRGSMHRLRKGRHAAHMKSLSQNSVKAHRRRCGIDGGKMAEGDGLRKRQSAIMASRWRGVVGISSINMALSHQRSVMCSWRTRALGVSAAIITGKTAVKRK